MASMSMTVYYILPIKAELFYIFFMEAVHSHKLKDATVWDILLVVLCFPASSAAVSGFSGEHIKSCMHMASLCSSCQARDGMTHLSQKQAVPKSDESKQLVAQWFVSQL